MPDLVIYADTVRSPEMRHEIPLTVPDPFLFIEHDGRRHVAVGAMEVSRISGIDGGLDVRPSEEFGRDELTAQGLSPEEVNLEVVVRACQELGVQDATVPAGFPVETADRLRRAGIEVSADRELFAARRRRKTAAELEGVRRAQRAAEAGMRAAAELLRRAEPNGRAVLLDGEPLTCERLKLAIGQAFSASGAAADEFIVAHGAQSAVGHDMGSGPIMAGEPVVVDLWPRDGASACFADMTRTFVVGEPDAELRAYHRLAREALDRSVEAIRAGVAGAEVFRISCAVFEGAGQPTQLTKKPGEILLDGFFHGLGHGVGLEVHEPPYMGRAPGELIAGDVVSVEPGCYRQGYGGCRLEDIVLVTDDGAEVLTDFPYQLAP
jgi:Xaa-Pro aminopeptidase